MAKKQTTYRASTLSNQQMNYCSVSKDIRPDLETAEILNTAEDINNASKNINLLLQTGWTFHCWPDCRLEASSEALKLPRGRTETLKEDAVKVCLCLTFLNDKFDRRTCTKRCSYHGNRGSSSPSPPASISPAEPQRVAGTTLRPRRQITQQDAETEGCLLRTDDGQRGDVSKHQRRRRHRRQTSAL